VFYSCYLFCNAVHVVEADPKIATVGVCALTVVISDSSQGSLIFDSIANFEIRQTAQLFRKGTFWTGAFRWRVEFVAGSDLQHPRATVGGDAD